MSEAQVIDLSEYRPIADEPQPEQEPGIGLEKLKCYWREAEESHQKPRELAFRDRDYYDNYDDDQWTAYEKGVLKRRRQQVSTSNKIKKKINSILGYEKQNRTDPKAWPRHPDAETAADIAVDALDYIENNIRFDRLASRCAKNLAIEGIEAAEIIIDQKTGEIACQMISYDRFFYDPRSMEPDFSDARYMGYAEWLDADVAKAKYGPEKASLIDDMFDGEDGYDRGYEDKPYGIYAQKDRRRVRVIVCYYLTANDEWRVAHFTGSGVLVDEMSPWPEENGNACGIIPQSLYINREGYRFGLVRDDISIQNDINQRKSKSLHLLNDRRTWGVDGWAPDEQDAKEALARPDGHVKVTAPLGSTWGLLDSTAEIQGNLELLQQSIADMEIQGIYTPGDSGRAQDQSGRAILALQQAGIVGEGGFFDSHDEWKLRCYRRFWFMAKKFWNGPRWIRITKDEKASRFVAINQPIGMDPYGRPIIQNPISQIDVDIIVETGPDTVVLQHEQFEVLAKILPQLAQMPTGFAAALIESSQLRHKDKIIEALEQFSQPPQPDPLMIAEKEAAIRNKDADTKKKLAETQGKQVQTAKAFADAQAGPEPKDERVMQ